jgi:hypothetical protein
MHKAISIAILFVFAITSVQSPGYAQVSAMPFMPKPGTIVHLSPAFTPAHLKGIVIHPENALKFDFIIYKGDKPLTDSEKKEEYTKLTKYFLASLAIPDEDQWVNLSPYEKDRIIKDDFGKTEMGRDLLAQDYLLKQITASLIYPQDSLGKKFWDKVYSEAQKQYGSTNIPVNTFNKVWILPDDALIYEKDNTAYVLKNHLKVMLEEDYLSLQKHSGITNLSSPNALIGDPGSKSHSIASKIVREIVLPELQREVNEDQNFAPVRQVYSGMLLAAWYKRALKESLLSKIYANKARVKGVDQDPKTNEVIFQQYLAAYKKGVFNFIREDADKYTSEMIPRKYFSGGAIGYINAAMQAGHNVINIAKSLDFAQQASMLKDRNKNDLAQVSVEELSRVRKLLQKAGILPKKDLNEMVLLQKAGMEKQSMLFGSAENLFRKIVFVWHLTQDSPEYQRMDAQNRQELMQLKENLEKFLRLLNGEPVLINGERVHIEKPVYGRTESEGHYVFTRKDHELIDPIGEAFQKNEYLEKYFPAPKPQFDKNSQVAKEHYRIYRISPYSFLDSVQLTDMVWASFKKDQDGTFSLRDPLELEDEDYKASRLLSYRLRMNDQQKLAEFLSKANSIWTSIIEKTKQAIDDPSLRAKALTENRAGFAIPHGKDRPFYGIEAPLSGSFAK